MHLDFSWSLILGTENTVDVDESLFDDLDLDGEEFEDDSEEDNWIRCICILFYPSSCDDVNLQIYTMKKMKGNVLYEWLVSVSCVI